MLLAGPAASGADTVRMMGREQYSRQRIEDLGERLCPLAEVLAEEPLCIYVTGSYGRLEAGVESDIDVFYLYEGHPVRPLSRLTLIQVSARLIEAAAAMGFPPFSGDGRYLDVHYLDQMEEVLGSPEDDSLNAFTARMLLLLESRPVFAAERYERFLQRVVGFYFRDFADHRQSFRPTFLLNDILRFWRTLTLNYEHDRYEISLLMPQRQAEAKARSALKNYKLKVSRLATCFSMVLHLASEEPPLTPQRVLALCALTPRQRFEALAEGHGTEAAECVARLLTTYAAFLDHVQQPADALGEAFRDEQIRAERLAEAREFGEQIFALFILLVPRERLQQLIV
jgi:predicted nucleotidyltransferase